MEITSINTAYAMGTNDYAVKKNNDVERKSQTNNVEEYYEKLCKKFPQISFNTQGGVMPCSPGKTVVNLSPDCLKKMANDPEFAKEVEWNLSGEEKANALIYSWAKRDGIEIYGKTVSYDADGNRESSYGMRTANVGNGNSTSKIQKKYKEEEELWIKARKKREEKEKAEARIEEKRRESKSFKNVWKKCEAKGRLIWSISIMLTVVWGLIKVSNYHRLYHSLMKMRKALGSGFLLAKLKERCVM